MRNCLFQAPEEHSEPALASTVGCLLDVQMINGVMGKGDVAKKGMRIK